MLKFKKGDLVKIVKPIFVRKKDGSIVNLTGRKGVVVIPLVKKCRCDFGLEKQMLIPNTHLDRLEEAA